MLCAVFSTARDLFLHILPDSSRVFLRQHALVDGNPIFRFFPLIFSVWFFFLSCPHHRFCIETVLLDLFGGFQDLFSPMGGPVQFLIHHPTYISVRILYTSSFVGAT